MQLTVAELARRLEADVEGDGSVEIRGVAGIREAQPGEVTFLSNPRYAPAVEKTRASAILVPRSWDRPAAAALVRVDDPDKAFAEVAVWFAPPPVRPAPGVHPAAVVAPDVQLGADVSIGPCAVLEAGVRIGARSVVGALCCLGHGVTLGEDCRLHAHVSVREHVTVGNRVILHNGVVIGSDGFGYTVDGQGVRHKIPQIGAVRIGDDVEIGANTTIDRARFGVTRIGNGVKIDNLVQIAHNVTIGDHAVIVSQAGVAGSAQIGARAILAGQAGISGHLVIGEGAIVGPQAGVSKDVPPGATVLGSPAIPQDRMARSQAHIMRLPQLKKKVAGLGERLKRLEEKLGIPPEF